MIRLIISLFLLTCIIISGCKRNKTPEQLIVTFNDNKKTLDVLINNLKRDKALDSLFQIGPERGLPNIEVSHPDIYSMLNKTGITDASSHENAFPIRTRWYYFKTNWPNEHPIYLIFNDYDSSETTNGFYSKDEVLNETWGLGNSWKMFRFVKFRPYKQ